MNFKNLLWSVLTGRGSYAKDGKIQETRYQYDVPALGLLPANPSGENLEQIRLGYQSALNSKRKDEKFTFATQFALIPKRLQVSIPDGYADVQQWYVVTLYNGKEVRKDLALNIAEQIEFDSLDSYAESSIASIRANHAKIFEEEKL